MVLSEGAARCDELAHPNAINLIISIIILVGMLISYLPQHVRIIQRRTSEGISPYYILLGTTSATAGFANIVLLPQSRQDVACCSDLEPFQCIIGLLGIAQLGVQWICVSFIFVLFLVFFRYNTSVVPEEELSDEPPSWREVLFVSSLILLHGLFVLIVTAVLGAMDPQHLSLWANILGVMSAVLAAVQYIPQIWTTYHLKHVGSLSIPMMCIQTPGGFLFAFSLFMRLGPGGWSSWGIFLMTATMQGILLCMAINYELQARRQQGIKNPHERQRHPNLYANGFDDDQPGRYENHPEHYAESLEHLARMGDREELLAQNERQPLLKPGGIGTPYQSSDFANGSRD